VVVGDPDLLRDTLLYNVFSPPSVIYSAEKNILISPIFKNCSSSLELWCWERHNYLEIPPYQTSFYYITWLEARRIIRERQPEMITVLRDPVKRASSAIRMRAQQNLNEGIEVDWNNFRALHVVQDPHHVPQSCFVPLSTTNDHLGFETPDEYMLSDLGGWPSILDRYNLVSKLSEKNTFFYMLPGENVMQDLAEYIDEPELQTAWDNKSTEARWLNFLGPMPEDYRKYLKDAYRHDYELISAVKFVNCTQEQINNHTH